MLVRTSWITLAAALVLVGCEDTTGPVNDRAVSPQFDRSAAPELRTLRQSPDAPPLETYRVSFWAFVRKASTVQVSYQPAARKSKGDPFLRFEIPKHGLQTRADGTRLQERDSVYITLTIDPVTFDVHFEPSGVRFSLAEPARLTLWYRHADPDLNDDGVVDATDQALAWGVAVWSQTKQTKPWHKMASKNDTNRKVVTARLHHFSEYAVCW